MKNSRDSKGAQSNWQLAIRGLHFVPEAVSNQQSAFGIRHSAKPIYRKGREGRQGGKESSISDPFATFASVAVKFLSRIKHKSMIRVFRVDSRPAFG